MLDGGAIRWKCPLEDFYRSPAVAGERVFFGDAKGTVHALAVESGRWLWSRSVGAAISTGPLALGHELVLGDEHGTIHRIDQASGAIRAAIPVDGIFTGPPVALGDSLVLLAGDDAIACLDLAAARVRWTRALRVSSSRPYVWHGSVLVATTKGELIAFRAVDGMPLWTRTFKGIIRGIGQDDRTLYVGTQQGMIYAYRRFLPAASPLR